MVPPPHASVFSAASSPAIPTNAQQAAALCTEGSVPRKAPSITEDIHPLPVIFAILASPFSQI